MNTIQQLLERTDVYLIDQILKGRYLPNEKILDAGCGSGRNTKWFYDNDFSVYAIDASEEAIQYYRAQYPRIAENSQVGQLDALPYEDNFFHHIICSAVLHFAKNEAHFKAMFAELSRVVRPQGTLFFRMTTLVGVETTTKAVGDGVYYLKDDSHRFLLTRPLLITVLAQNNMALVEPFKTTVVEDVRSMSTVLVTKSPRSSISLA